MIEEKLETQSANLIHLFILYGIFSVAGIFSGFREYFLIQKILIWEGDFSSEIASLSVFQSVVNILRGLTNIFLAFYFIRWLYHSTLSLKRNPEVFYLNSRPASAIWSWFIPVVNLILPFLVVRENYETWENLKSQNSKNSSGIVVWWWLSFISSTAAGYFGIGMLDGINSPDLDKYSGNPWPFFLPGLIELISILISIRMMRRFKAFYEPIVGA